VKSRKPLKYGVGFALVGAVIATALLVYDHLLIGPDNLNHATAVDADLFLILCPSSIILMGLERVSSIGLLFGFAFIVLTNAGLYGLAGLLCGAISESFRPSPR
jgi:hypothetical protein